MWNQGFGMRDEFRIPDSECLNGGVRSGFGLKIRDVRYERFCVPQIESAAWRFAPNQGHISGRYNSSTMGPRDEPSAVLSADTTRQAERLQVIAWRSMSSVQRAQLVAAAGRAVRGLALAGLRQRHPGASEAEIVARLSLLTLGRPLAQRVYPDLIDVPDASGD